MDLVHGPLCLQRRDFCAKSLFITDLTVVLEVPGGQFSCIFFSFAGIFHCLIIYTLLLIAVEEYFRGNTDFAVFIIINLEVTAFSCVSVSRKLDTTSNTQGVSC